MCICYLVWLIITYVLGLGRINCSNCHKSFKNHRSLVEHLRTDCGKPPKFSCGICGFATKRKHGLKKHLLVKHDVPVDTLNTMFKKNV